MKLLYLFTLTVNIVSDVVFICQKNPNITHYLWYFRLYVKYQET